MSSSASSGWGGDHSTTPWCTKGGGGGDAARGVPGDHAGGGGGGGAAATRAGGARGRLVGEQLRVVDLDDRRPRRAADDLRRRSLQLQLGTLADPWRAHAGRFGLFAGRRSDVTFMAACLLVPYRPPAPRGIPKARAAATDQNGAVQPIPTQMQRGLTKGSVRKSRTERRTASCVRTGSAARARRFRSKTVWAARQKSQIRVPIDARGVWASEGSSRTGPSLERAGHFGFKFHAAGEELCWSTV